MSAKIRINKAATDGLILAAVTIILSLVKELVSQAWVSPLIWIVKLAATLIVLHYLMKKNTELNTLEKIETTYGNSFKYGFIVSLFSVIVITLYLYIYTSINSTEIAQQTELALQEIEDKGLDEQTGELAYWILNNIKATTILSSLILYTIWSAIASAIMASSTKSPNNPFKNIQD